MQMGARRTVGEILAERRSLSRPRAQEDLQWEAIEALDGQLVEVREALGPIQADVAFIARATRIVVVGAPVAAAAAVILKALGVVT
jgi:hypothetical protein